MVATPPSKEWVRRAVRRQGAPRCPVRNRRLSFDVMLRHADGLADLFCEFPDDTVFLTAYDLFVGYQSPQRTERVNPVEALMHNARWTDEWGTGWGHSVGGVALRRSITRSRIGTNWTTISGRRFRIRWPRAGWIPSDRRWRCTGRRNIAWRTSICRFLSGCMRLRGLQNAFADFYTNEDEVRRLLDALAEYLIALTRSLAQIGVDAVFYTDDWGTQKSLMISPAMWRSFFKDHYRRVFAEAHRLGLDVILHSCGNVMSIVPDLIDVGVDVLDPLQPGAMDVAELGRRFGGHLAFCGGVDIQDLLPFGSPRQIKDSVRRLIDTLGRPFGNSLIVAPANTVTPEVPLENFRALFEASHSVT